ncbi:MAG TPA: hypothetical protein VMF13_14680 [Luteitalea sp.]|nr:hypothetical protein [Luteitalea sp.]
MTRVAGHMLGTMERLQLTRCVLGRRLPCGCDIGLYEKHDGGILTIVDEPSDSCLDRSHQADFVIGREPAPARDRAATY